MVGKLNSVLACSVLMALGGCLGGGSSDSASSQPGAYAAEQMRYVATSLKGRMAGTEQEHKTAKYLQDEFKKIGYADTTLQSFTAKEADSKSKCNAPQAPQFKDLPPWKTLAGECQPSRFLGR